MSDDFESVEPGRDSMTSSPVHNELVSENGMDDGDEKDDSPLTEGIMKVLGSQSNPHICYRYPVTPVYIKLPKPIQELGDIYMQMVMPVDFKRVNWEFTQSADRHHVWNCTEIVNIGHHTVRVTFQDLVDGKEDKYEWHNSDVGSVCPVFKPHSEHFMQLHYDKEEKQLVSMPFSVNLNGPVVYNDTYSIRFNVKPNGKKMSLNFGEITFHINLEEHKELMGNASYEEMQVSSHSSCAFVTLNRKIIDQSMRRLVTPVMIIDGDIELVSLQIVSAPLFL
ncbi:hypothetical protein V5799_020003 [Amblyomma americanum]|uniref:Uncharacterized protein n=1 Tax=Amblyomma americanum TaxID=6943 RepID=A0AAQ4EW16_AMBAM